MMMEVSITSVKGVVISFGFVYETASNSCRRRLFYHLHDVLHFFFLHCHCVRRGYDSIQKNDKEIMRFLCLYTVLACVSHNAALAKKTPYGTVKLNNKAMPVTKSDSQVHYKVTLPSEVMDIVKKTTAPGKPVVLLLDVDDTIILPKSKTFHQAPYNKMMDEIKANKGKYPRFIEIISQWRAQREAMLIHETWPQVLEDLKSVCPVYGLTKVNTGQLGVIDSMEAWRYKELKALRIEFTCPEGTQPNVGLASNPDYPAFYQGIMMTGSASKYDTLSRFQDVIPEGAVIIFVDDRLKNVDELAGFAKDHGYGFVGIHYRGLDILEGKADPQIAALQKEVLVSEHKWLEDHEAAMRLGK